MKKRIIKPFLCLLALALVLAGCARALPVATEGNTTPPTQAKPGALEALRSDLAQTDALFAVAYLGYMDAEPQGYLMEWVIQSNPKLVVRYPFLAKIDNEHCVGTVGQVFCIIPRSPQASVTAEVVVWDGDTYTPDRRLYTSESGEPILVTCNGGNCWPDTSVTVTEGGRSVVWYPALDESGRVGLPFEEDKVLATDIGLYEAAPKDPYLEYVQSGWLMPTEEALKNTSWTAEVFVNGEPAWLFMDLQADGTARMELASKETAQNMGVYTGTWRVYVENRNFLELALSGPNGATVEDAYAVYISPSGLDLILGKGIMGTELPCDVLDPNVLASFAMSVG